MKSYTNEIIVFNGCPGCAYAKHEFELPCGMAYENDNFTLSQDWELPIEGFLIDKTIKILRENDVCDRFEIIFEEKENRHLHVWIMPRHEWMTRLVDDIIDNIGVILEYAKTNFRNKDVYERINNITKLVKENF